MPDRAILFDLDGTLVDIEQASIAAMAQVLHRELGIAIGQQERDYQIGRSWRAVHDNLRDRHPAMIWTEAELIARTAAERESMLAGSEMPVLPGAAKCLQRFSGWPLALVTGSARVEVDQVMDATGWRSHFAAMVVSEDVENSKPAPDGYLAAAQALGVEPGACIVVEDSTPGIASGLAAGARVVAVRAGNTVGHDQSRAHRVIDTLDELTEDLIESLLAG